MSLNWSFEVILTFLSLIPFFISFAVSVYQYWRTHYQHNLFLYFIWLSYILWWVFHGISKLLLSKSLYWVSGIFITAELVSIIIFGESLEHDVKISMNLLLLLLLQSIIVVFLYDENYIMIVVYENNEFGLRVENPVVQIIMFLEMILSSIYVLIIMTKIYLNVPVSMKRKSFFSVFGTVLFLSLGYIYVMLKGDQFIPGLNMLFNLLGALIFGVSFLKEPRIFHVLSFKMLRLQVMDIKSGIGIYSHTWRAGKEIGDEVLFSGMLQGIGLILQESVKRGDVDEIKLSKGIIIVKRIPNSSIACVLVATKSTAPLRNALTTFTQRFADKFRDQFNNIGDLSEFDQASTLIGDSFPFLWEE